jgi:hypothetical protein
MTDGDLNDALREVVRRGVVDDAVRVRGLLADLLPGQGAVVRVAVAAVHEGVPRDLRQAVMNGSVSLAVARGIDRLVSEHAYDRTMATRVVEAWAGALGPEGTRPSPERTANNDGAGGGGGAKRRKKAVGTVVLDDVAGDGDFRTIVVTRRSSVSLLSSARVAPWLNSRAYIKQVATDAGLWHSQTQGLHNGSRVQMSGAEWEENARAAYNKGQGWLHAYSGDGTLGPTNQAYHDAVGTNASRRETLTLSVGDPFSEGSRTVMIGVRVPTDITGKDYMVQHLIWHNNRYIPVNGVDHHGNAFQVDQTYNTNKKNKKDVGDWNSHGTSNNYYESKAMQHICEHAALYLPGYLYTERQEGRTACVDDHNALTTITYGVRRAGAKALIDYINSTSTANNWTFPRRAGQVAKSDNSVGRHISTIRGVKHGSYENDSNITDADARTSANTLQDTMNDNVVRGMRQFGAGHKAYRAAGQALPPGQVLHLAHQGSDASFSDINLHSDLEWS